MSLTPSEIGERAEAGILAALVRAGKFVYLPFGASGRADLVFEDKHGFHSVQCKSGRVLGDVVFFLTASRTNNEPKDYRGEVDFFAVYCHARAEAYLIPVDDVPKRAAHLRLRPTRNGQAKGIRWASDYLLG